MLFNPAIDSKLRCCYVVRVDDVAPNGHAMDRATIRQKRTGRSVRFELTDQTRLAIDEYLRLTGRKSGQSVCWSRRRLARTYREAFEIVRSLIEQVRIIPVDGEVTIELQGQLAGILVLAEGAKRPSASLGERALQIMVAGARNHLDLQLQNLLSASL